MKLYTLHQRTYHEGEFGDLESSGSILIGVYTDIKVPTKIVEEFVPVKFHAQFGTGLQDLYITEIETDVQLAELCTNNGFFDWGQNED